MTRARAADDWKTVETNKSIDLANNTLVGTKAQFNTALSDGDFATQAGTETLTAKTIDLANNTLTGTKAQFNTALSDADFAVVASTSVPTAAGSTALTSTSNPMQIFTGSTTQDCVLPSTAVAGQEFFILNLSSGLVTVKSSDGSTLIGLGTEQAVRCKAINTTPTTTVSWFTTHVVKSASVLYGNDGSGNPLLLGWSFAATAFTAALRNTQSNLVANGFVPSLTPTVTAAGTTTLVIGSTQVQLFTGSTTQTVTLPTTSIVAGMWWRIINKSSGTVTVNSSAGNLVKSLAANTSTTVTACQATPTADTHWDAT